MKSDSISQFKSGAAGGSVTPSLRFAIMLALVYFVVVLWCVFHHVMWRDEWFGWLASHHVSSFSELYSLRGNQTVPIGWPLLTWLVGRLGSFPVGAQILQAFVAAGGIFLLARFSKLSRLQVVLAACSYFLLYEYGTFLRNYIYQVFFLFVACALMTSGKQRIILIGVALGLLFITTHAFGLLLGCILGGVYLVSLRNDWLQTASKPSLSALLIGISIGLAAMYAAYTTMNPTSKEMWVIMGGIPNDTPFLERVFVTVIYFFRGMFPLSFQGLWNTQILDPWPWFQFCLALIVFLALIPLFWRRPAALLLYCGGTLVLTAVLIHLALRSPFVALRYHGQFFLIFLLACWMFNSARDCGRLPRFVTWSPFRWLTEHRSSIITAILGIQAIAGVLAVAHEQIIPISGSREAAEIIRQKVPESLPIIGDLDYAMEPLSGYLDRPIFVASRGEYTRYLIYDKKRRREPLAPEALSQAVQNLMASEKSDVILVVNYPIGLQGQGVEQLGAVTRTMVSDEAYWIYRIKYAGL